MCSCIKCNIYRYYLNNTFFLFNFFFLGAWADGSAFQLQIEIKGFDFHQASEFIIYWIFAILNV
jgi:hypothetical protein